MRTMVAVLPLRGTMLIMIASDLEVADNLHGRETKDAHDDDPLAFLHVQ